MSPLPQSQIITLVDSHCHLDMAAYENDLEEVIDKAFRKGIREIITIGVNATSSKVAVELAQQYPQVYAAVGIHPHDAGEASEKDFDSILKLATDKKVVGYGEIGLDYAKLHSPRDIQQEIFARQLSMAKELQLPVIIHDREAHEDTLRILRQYSPFPAGGVMHCFSGDTAFAKQVLDIGFYISIPGIVTFKNATDLQKVVCEIPLQAMLIETDGPFLAPVPYRGKRNTSEYLLHTAEKIAKLRSTTLTEVALQTTTNSRKLFNLPNP